MTHCYMAVLFDMLCKEEEGLISSKGCWIDFLGLRLNDTSNTSYDISTLDLYKKEACGE